MRLAGEVFGEPERRRVRDAVAAAERGTAAEIVPLVATASGAYERAADLVGLVCAGLGLFLLWWLMLPGGSAGTWYPPVVSVTGFGMLLALGVLGGGFWLGVTLAGQWGWLKRLFVSRARLEQQVGRAAAQAFAEHGVSETSGRTGVLIYLSLFEGRVRVIGDLAISRKLPPEHWQQLCAAIEAGLARGAAADALVAGIERCGALLAGPFPADEQRRDEVGNTLRILD
jgi:putative membrane protein